MGSRTGLKMASQRLAADLDFLTDAAHLLRQTAPETSAHLMRQRADLMYHNGLAQHELHRQHVCDACGHIMIPGQKTTLKLDGRRSMDKAASTGPVKSITCGHCKRATRISLPAPEAVSRRKTPQAPAINKKTNMPVMPVSGLHDQKPASNASNASSKKRAKNRRGGLQALLSGQQQKSSKSLSLADFVK
ncbi:hypothetical protein C2857_006964 [Epichloe festucae Fl1]|uniref:Uncharacterized protein n=1 Tax=Epichloe festucae (strain Fl1) TaxID=877507 RepID=A0A7S9KQD0_EPIFF|nr:hypothetical protein C2857_006964 [Epichloe festucae Fl1]